MRRLVYFFLLNLIVNSPAYAGSIVDVQEFMTVIAREDINNCEWIETTEVKTVTTYRESYTTHYNEYVPGEFFYSDYQFPASYSPSTGERA